MLGNADDQPKIGLDHQVDGFGPDLGLLRIAVIAVVDDFPPENLFLVGCQQWRLANLTHVSL